MTHWAQVGGSVVFPEPSIQAVTGAAVPQQTHHSLIVPDSSSVPHSLLPESGEQSWQSELTSVIDPDELGTKDKQKETLWCFSAAWWPQQEESSHQQHPHCSLNNSCSASLSQHETIYCQQSPGLAGSWLRLCLGWGSSFENVGQHVSSHQWKHLEAWPKASSGSKWLPTGGCVSSLLREQNPMSLCCLYCSIWHYSIQSIWWSIATHTWFCTTTWSTGHSLVGPEWEQQPAVDRALWNWQCLLIISFKHLLPSINFKEPHKDHAALGLCGTEPTCLWVCVIQNRPLESVGPVSRFLSSHCLGNLPPDCLVEDKLS